MPDREQNERLLRDLIDVFWNQQRLDRYDDFFALDFKIHTGAADYSGRSGMCDGFAGPFFEGFPDLHHEVEFLLIEGSATSLFFVLAAISLFDVLSGFTVSIRAAGRDINFQ